MKKILAVAACAAVMGMTGNAMALSFTDLDTTSVSFSESGITSYTWTFDLAEDILTVGDIDDNDIINWTKVGFTVSDDSGDLFGANEYIDLTVNGTKYLNDWEMDNGIYATVGTFTSATTYDFTITFDDYDGWWYHNSTTVSNVKIFGDYTEVANQSAVPEPTTMLLFGTGLAGLAGAARRKRK